MLFAPYGHNRTSALRAGSSDVTLIGQILGGICVGVALPYFAGSLAYDSFIGTPLADKTAIASACAITLSAIINRRLSTYPGIRAHAFVFASIAASFLMLLTIVVLARVEYSRFLLGSSFLASIIWFYLLTVRTVLRKYRIGIVPFGDVADLREIKGIEWVELVPNSAHSEPLSAVVADLRANLPGSWDAELADFALSGLPVYHVKLLKESLTGTVELEHLSENSFGTLAPTFGYFQLKRVLDTLAALICILISAPLLAACAVMVRMDSVGPAIFKQNRIGYRGEVFTVYKFRTMKVQRDSNIDERRAAQTQQNDSRITRLGQILRKSRIDELPQLWNILRGEMSFIGPRPEAQILSEWYQQKIPYYKYRHIILPGITGWAQVNQGHVSEVDEVQGKLNYDFYYIKYFSPWLDLLIVAKTIKTMLTGFGSR